VSVASSSQKTEVTPITALDRVHITAPISFASTVSDKDFEQATALWHVIGKQDGAQLRLANNVAAHVSGVKEKWIREEVYGTISSDDRRNWTSN
jgi:catalase